MAWQSYAGSVAGAASGGGLNDILNPIQGGIYGTSRLKNEKEVRRMMKLEREIAQTQWADWLQNYRPLEAELASGVRDYYNRPLEEDPGFLRMLNQAEKSYGDASALSRRAMAGRYESGAGLEEENARRLALARTAGIGNIWSDARTNRDLNRFSLMMQAANLGRGMPAQSIQAGAVSGGMGLDLMRLNDAYRNSQGSAAAGGMQNLIAGLMQIRPTASTPASTSPQNPSWYNNMMAVK